MSLPAAWSFATSARTTKAFSVPSWSARRLMEGMGGSVVSGKGRTLPCCPGAYAILRRPRAAVPFMLPRWYSRRAIAQNKGDHDGDEEEAGEERDADEGQAREGRGRGPGRREGAGEDRAVLAPAGRTKPRKPPSDYKYVEGTRPPAGRAHQAAGVGAHAGAQGRGDLRGPRRGRQGRRDQAHRRMPEPAHLPHRRPGHAHGARTQPVVLPALRAAPARRGRDRPLRSQLVQPRRRGARHGLLHRGRVRGIPALLPAVRGDAGALRHRASSSTGSR